MTGLMIFLAAIGVLCLIGLLALWVRLAGTEEEPDRPDYLCPNCVTPWKCNGPHISEEPS